MNTIDLLGRMLTDPNVVYLLLIAGIWCAALALTTPGTGAPEAGAIVFLSLAVFGLIRLPVNVIGLFLIGLSLALYVLEIKWPSHGAFLITGVLTLAGGSFFLFSADENIAPLSLGLVALVVLGTTGFFGFALRKALEAGRRPPAQNPDSVIGAVGEAKTDILKDGAVQVADELWTAEADEFIPAGTRVQIIRRSGLRLIVSRVKP